MTSIGTGYEIWLTSGGALTGLITGGTAFGAGLGVAVTTKRAPRSVRRGLAVLAATLAGSLVVIAGVAAVILERVCEQSQTASA